MNRRFGGRTEFSIAAFSVAASSSKLIGRPHRSHDLRLSDEQYRPRGILGAVRGHRRQAADRADLAIGKSFFAINLCGVHGCLRPSVVELMRGYPRDRSEIQNPTLAV